MAAASFSGRGLSAAQLSDQLRRAGDAATLESLDASQNALTSSEFLSQLPRLRQLDASHNSLTALARLPPTLVSLRARFNKLSQMSGLPASLVELDLSSNLIDSTRGLATCTRLQRLRLAHNRIRRVEQLESLTQLRELDLTANLIARVEDVSALAANSRLHSLALDENRVAQTARFRLRVAALLPQLTALNGVPLRAPPLVLPAPESESSEPVPEPAAPQPVRKAAAAAAAAAPAEASVRAVVREIGALTRGIESTTAALARRAAPDPAPPTWEEDEPASPTLEELASSPTHALQARLAPSAESSAAGERAPATASGLPPHALHAKLFNLATLVSDGLSAQLDAAAFLAMATRRVATAASEALGRACDCSLWFLAAAAADARTAPSATALLSPLASAAAAAAAPPRLTLLATSSSEPRRERVAVAVGGDAFTRGVAIFGVAVAAPAPAGHALLAGARASAAGAELACAPLLAPRPDAAQSDDVDGAQSEGAAVVGALVLVLPPQPSPRHAAAAAAAAAGANVAAEVATVAARQVSAGLTALARLEDAARVAQSALQSLRTLETRVAALAAADPAALQAEAAELRTQLQRARADAEAEKTRRQTLSRRARATAAATLCRAVTRRAARVRLRALARWRLFAAVVARRAGERRVREAARAQAALRALAVARAVARGRAWTARRLAWQRWRELLWAARVHHEGAERANALNLLREGRQQRARAAADLEELQGRAREALAELAHVRRSSDAAQREAAEARQAQARAEAHAGALELRLRQTAAAWRRDRIAAGLRSLAAVLTRAAGRRLQTALRLLRSVVVTSPRGASPSVVSSALAAPPSAPAAATTTVSIDLSDVAPQSPPPPVAPTAGVRVTHAPLSHSGVGLESPRAASVQSSHRAVRGSAGAALSRNSSLHALSSGADSAADDAPPSVADVSEADAMLQLQVESAPPSPPGPLAAEAEALLRAAPRPPPSVSEATNAPGSPRSPASMVFSEERRTLVPLLPPLAPLSPAIKAPPPAPHRAAVSAGDETPRSDYRELSTAPQPPLSARSFADEASVAASPAPSRGGAADNASCAPTTSGSPRSPASQIFDEARRSLAPLSLAPALPASPQPSPRGRSLLRP